MIEASNVSLPLDAGLPAGQKFVRRAAARALGVKPDAIAQVRVLKRSVDARKKADVHFVATLGIELRDAADEVRVLTEAAVRKGAGAAKGTHLKEHATYQPLAIPECAPALAAGEARPLVVGLGPAGLFAALYLARAGLRPLVIERGADVDARVAAVDAFNRGGPLDLHTNIQFGEGGAGTFSDGKLTTNVKNPNTAHVLRWFVDAGAPEEILWEAKPHMGTDRLVGVVRTMRQQIQQAGGEVRFLTQLTGLDVADGVVRGVALQDVATGTVEKVAVSQVVLACGHSARDTFEALYEAGAAMEQKPFSVGVRIEHPQALINQAQYGAAAKHPALDAADYKLAVHLPGGRSVYTFCMCPGGQVVCAASEEGGVVVNGMSRFARDGENANSAVLVGVGPQDFEGDHPLAGVKLQRSMEQAAYSLAVAAGGKPYQAPAQTVGSFLSGAEEGAFGEGGADGEACGAGASGQAASAAGDGAQASRSRSLPGAAAASRTSEDGALLAEVHPTYARGVAWCNLRECLPPFVSEALEQAFPLLDRKLRGFADPAAVMTGVETRSSSPVRVVRGENLQATFLPDAALTCNDACAGDLDGAAEGLASNGGFPAAAVASPARASGLYPCGEGPGYAGGIMSAACDGLRVAQQVAQAYADATHSNQE